MTLLSGHNNHADQDFEYWEFVHCAICFLPFVPDPTNIALPPSVPFWLTECGHTVCNNHLNADQSCAPCGARSIQLVPLQRDMAPPMSNWFSSIPQVLEDLTHAVKFQQENMASIVRFYKRKCSQLHSKTKTALSENKSLQSQVEQLQHENAQLRVAAGLPEKRQNNQSYPYGSNLNHHAVSEGYEPGTSRNVNGKRPLADPHLHQRTSSPRSIVTPLGPPRITLPPDHQQPVFPSGMTAEGGMQPHAEAQDTRPGSSRFAQYAFQPPVTPLCPQALRHQQQSQSHRQQQIEGQRVHQHGHAQQQQTGKMHSHHQHQQMPPPPTPGRAATATTSQHQTSARGPFRPARQISVQSARNAQMQMPPPPPRVQASLQSTSSSSLRPQQPFPLSNSDAITVSTGNAFTSPRPPSTANANRRMRTVPQTPSNRFFAPRANGSTSGAPPSMPGYPGTVSSGSARTQFVPGRG